MKKIVKFFKDYGFYVAITIICVGALAAIFIMPDKSGNVADEANPYAKHQSADANDVGQLPDDSISITDEDDLDTTDEASPEEVSPEESAENEVTLQESPEEAQVEESAAPAEEETKDETANASEETKDEAEEVKPDTFDSTTAAVTQEPFFADGDTFNWPVDGKVVVPYTDESTKYWYSQSLNETMRTFGICISGSEGEEVKAVAKGTVTKVVDDSSTYLEKGMPYVGKLMVVDLGNGYTCIYGFQGGSVNEDLVGQVVNAGDVLGTIGSPKGAFISLGDNIYLQVTHNDEIVNPLNYLDLNNQAVKEDGVDMGFTK